MGKSNKSKTTTVSTTTKGITKPSAQKAQDVIQIVPLPDALLNPQKPAAPVDPAANPAAPADPATTKPKKKKSRGNPFFAYRVRKDIYTRGKVTYGVKQKNLPASKHVSSSKFYVGNPVPRAPLLTKLNKYATCQIRTRALERLAQGKIAKTLFSQETSEKDRQRMAAPLFNALTAKPGIVENQTLNKKQTISKTASARLLQAVDLYTMSLFETSKRLLDGARVLKLKVLKKAFIFFYEQSSYFGPRHPEFLKPIFQIFTMYDELSAQRPKYEKKKPEYETLKKEQKEKILVVLRKQIESNKGSDMYYAGAIHGLAARYGIEGVSEEVKTIMEVIGRSFISETLDRASAIAKGVNANNIHEAHVVLALKYMGLKYN